MPELRALAPRSFQRYVEPFLGSGCLYFDLAPSRALLSDINPHLIRTYKHIKQNCVSIFDLVSGLPDATHFYYLLRAIPQGALSPQERAASFLYLNRHCFNGVYRVNRKGEFNVPRGENTGNMPTLDALRRCADTMSSATLRCCDFEPTVNDCRNDDFLYLDPPYALCAEFRSGEYGPGCFSEHDFERFIAAVQNADSRGVKILISYGDSEFMRDAFRTWNLSEISVRRNVAGFASARKNATELLFRNYD